MRNQGVEEGEARPPLDEAPPHPPHHAPLRLGLPRPDTGVTRIKREIDTRMMAGRAIPWMRLVLVAAITIVAWLDALLVRKAAAPADLLLLAYLGFSAAMWRLARRNSRLVGAASSWEHWLDVGWFAGLAVLDGPTGNLLFLGLLFPFLVAGFRRGFLAALPAVAVSLVILLWPGLMLRGGGDGLDFDRLVTPYVILVFIVYMVSYWGRNEVVLKRRLEFVAEASKSANPRFGAEQTLTSLLERLRLFYDADSCLMVATDLGGAEVRLRRADRSNTPGACRARPIPENLVSRFLTLPPEAAVLYQVQAFSWLPREVRYFEYDFASGTRTLAGREAAEKLASLLNARCLATVPVVYRGQTLGRVFLVSSRPVFRQSDVFFISQVLDQVMPVIDNIRLVDRLAADAGLLERRRIALDLHDSIIQPYVGLRLALNSLRCRLESGGVSCEDIDSLVRITDEGIAELRQYVSRLKNGTAANGNLVCAIQSFAAKLGDATGIAIEVETEGPLCLDERLAAEAFQIVVEGLSNIRRHTRSMKATVTIACSSGNLLLRIKDYGGSPALRPFSPQSIKERSEALGGRAEVETGASGSTVTVTIPL